VLEAFNYQRFGAAKDSAMFTPRKNKETKEERQAKGLEKRLQRI
jgi:hypothetical protein